MTDEFEPVTLLKEFYNRNGCIRVRPDDPEKGRHGGVELRLVVGDMSERRQVLAAMKVLGIPHGRVYRKQKTRRQWVVPIYSRAEVVAFLKVVKPRNMTLLLKKVQGLSKPKAPPEG